MAGRRAGLLPRAGPRRLPRHRRLLRPTHRHATWTEAAGVVVAVAADDGNVDEELEGRVDDPSRAWSPGLRVRRESHCRSTPAKTAWKKTNSAPLLRLPTPNPPLPPPPLPPPPPRLRSHLPVGRAALVVRVVVVAVVETGPRDVVCAI